MVLLLGNLTVCEELLGNVSAWTEEHSDVHWQRSASHAFIALGESQIRGFIWIYSRVIVGKV